MSLFEDYSRTITQDKQLILQGTNRLPYSHSGIGSNKCALNRLGRREREVNRKSIIVRYLLNSL